MSLKFIHEVIFPQVFDQLFSFSANDYVVSTCPYPIYHLCALCYFIDRDDSGNLEVRRHEERGQCRGYGTMCGLASCIVDPLITNATNVSLSVL